MAEQFAFFKNFLLANCYIFSLDSEQMFKIDAIDRQLIGLLQRDGRMSYSQLAKEAGISRAAATARVRSLIQHGIVAIVAATDLMFLGYLVRTILCNVEGSSRRNAARHLAALPEVTYCIIGAGAADLQLEIACRDREHLTEVLEQIAAVEGVRIAATFEFLEMVKQSYGWEVPPPEG
jgi:Lrp/AsnC family transcriptional regulator for asnA, asnC and gidA